jgi:hypothetical protein
VGVALEAARVLASRPSRRWSLFVLLTDGEEANLMGAAGLVTDRTVMDRLAAYINLEAIGSSGVAALFETGPGNRWLVRPWARVAPHPRGGSYALEVYQRLPNDTDFSILKTRDIPGLNFAPIGDSYAYHTPRDTPDRLSSGTIRTTGENVVTIASALQEVDITARTTETATFFDIGGTAAVAYGPSLQWTFSILALALGVLAWVRLTADAVRDNGVWRWLLTLAWAWIGAAAVVAALVGTTWLLRAAREVYHPWYARPERLFVLLILVGATVGWGIARLGEWLPRRAHPVRHPVLAWSVALPAWLGLAALALWFAPAAAYLWILPLFTAGLLLSIVPPRLDAVVRLASLVILAVAATLWLRDTYDLLFFMVAMMGRLSIVTPATTYAALLAVAGVMIIPPLVGLLAAGRPLVRPWIGTSLLLLAVAVATGAAYMAPAYTEEQPLRRIVRALQDVDSTAAVWEVASVEPGLDLGAGAPGGWTPVSGIVPASIPWGRLAFPFVFRTAGPALGPAPAAVTGLSLTPLSEGTRLTLSIVPRERGLTVGLVLPPGITPARSSLPGVVRAGRWTATYVAPPPEGIAWEASFRDVAPERLGDLRVTIASSRFPGGAGWQGLPAWLPQQTAVWSATATWVVRPDGGPIAPVPPLR